MGGGWLPGPTDSSHLPLATTATTTNTTNADALHATTSGILALPATSMPANAGDCLLSLLEPAASSPREPSSPSSTACTTSTTTTTTHPNPRLKPPPHRFPCSQSICPHPHPSLPATDFSPSFPIFFEFLFLPLRIGLIMPPKPLQRFITAIYKG